MPYIGEQVNNVKQNTGLYTPSEILQLEKDGHWGGSLELIAEQTADGTSATIDFLDIKENIYEVHLLTYSNVGGTGADYDSIYMRLFENGVLESGSVYMHSNRRIRANGGSNEYKSSSSSTIFMHYGGVSNGANQKINAYAYFYGLGNSSKFSHVTNIGVCIPSASEGNIFSMVFGGAVLPQQSVVDGIRVFDNQPTGTSNIKTGSTFKLYGVKQ